MSVLVLADRKWKPRGLFAWYVFGYAVGRFWIEGLRIERVRTEVAWDELELVGFLGKAGFRPVLQKIAGTKEFKMVYDTGGGRMVKNIPVPPGDRVKFAITDDEILQLGPRGHAGLGLACGVVVSDATPTVPHDRGAACRSRSCRVPAGCSTASRAAGTPRPVAPWRA